MKLYWTLVRWKLDGGQVAAEAVGELVAAEAALESSLMETEW